MEIFKIVCFVTVPLCLSCNAKLMVLPRQWCSYWWNMLITTPRCDGQTLMKGANLEFWYFMVINALDVNDTDQVIVENEPHVLSYYAITRFLIYNRFIGAWALCAPGCQSGCCALQHPSASRSKGNRASRQACDWRCGGTQQHG